MKKGEIYEGVIEKVDFPNKGIVITDGQKVTVKNGMPGQKVRFMINKKRSGRAEGRLLEVLEKSPLETREPVCSIFPECGGCMYQTMSYENQLKMKECQVRELLDGALNGTDYQWEGIHGSPIEFRYRNKMEFSFGDAYKDGPLTLGLHKKGSTYDVLTADDCQLVHEDMTKILTCVHEYFLKRNVSYYKKMQHTGYLRHLLLRRGVTTGEILVHVITTSQEEHDLESLKEELLALPLEGKIVGIMHIINDSLSDVVQSDETRILYGQDFFYETLLGLRFKISTFSFFQPNSLAAEVLYSIVREYIGDTKDKVVFDLYSGTGTIAQLAASVADEVIGVEIVEEAVEAAKQNAALNNLSNCKFIAGDVLKVLDDLTEKPDVIILDPPRDGIHPKALPKILSYGVEYDKYMDYFGLNEENKNDYRGVIGLVKDAEGNINLIKDTNMYSMPDYTAMGDVLKNVASEGRFPGKDVVTWLRLVMDTTDKIKVHAELDIVIPHIDVNAEYTKANVMGLFKGITTKKEVVRYVFENTGIMLYAYLRGEEERREYLSGNIDINYFDYDDTHAKYSVGEIGNGMKYTIERAGVVRKIQAVEGSKLIFKKVLPLMGVEFVRYGMLTVVPFPFKYLREYIVKEEKSV